MKRKARAVRLSADEVAHFQGVLRGTKKPKKVSGPSGQHTKPGIMLRAQTFELDSWRAAADGRGRTLTQWICERLNIAAKREGFDPYDFVLGRK